MRERRPENVGIAASFEYGARMWPHVRVHSDRSPDIAPELPRTLTFRQVNELVRDASATLLRAGAERGRPVAITKKNHLDVLVLAAAANRIGAVPALLSSRIDPHDALVVLDRLDARVVITDAATLESGTMAAVDPQRRRERIVSVGSEAEGTEAWSALRGGPVPPEMPPLWHEPMLITHTSGTTDVPKLVLQSAAIAHRRMHAENIPVPGLRLTRNDRIAVCLQMAHARCVSAVMLALEKGIEVLALSDPEPQAAAERIASFSPTVVETHPNLYLLWESLTADLRRPFANVRLFANTFDAIHPATVLKFLESSRRRLPVWVQGWGQSESGAVTLAIYSAGKVRRAITRGKGLRDVGFAPPGMSSVQVRHPETGEPVRRGQPGQLHVRSQNIALTYVGQDDLFRKRLRGGEWSMGDIGRVRWTGGIDLLDRHIDQVDGVESCVELEDVLLARLPEANEVIVLRGDDGRPRAVVCTHHDAPLSNEAWAKAVRGLPDLGAPIHMPWAEVPRTGTWKVRRPHLRAQIFEAQSSAAKSLPRTTFSNSGDALVLDHA